MRRVFVACLTALGAAGVYFIVAGVADLITKPEWVYDPGAVVRPADYGPGGVEDTLLVFGAGLILVQASVIWRWRRSVVASRRALAARIEHEAPLLEDYAPGAAERRTGHMPAAQPQSNPFPLGNSCPAPTLGDDMTWTQRTFMTAVIAAIVGVAALMGWTAWTASQHAKPAPQPAPTFVLPADM